MIAILNGIRVLPDGTETENDCVLIDEGKIVSIGAVDSHLDCVRIDATGKWVTPGFIDAHTHISVRNEPTPLPALLDGNEVTTPVTAHVRALDALNPHDMAIEHVRTAGFTTCYITPGSGNAIGGTGIAIKTRKRSTMQELILQDCQHMKFALGENPKRVYGDKGKLPSTRMGTSAVIRETLYRAKKYSDKMRLAENDPSLMPEYDFQLDALIPAVRGEMVCRFHAHRADDIVTAVRIAQEFGLRFSIEHATEGYKIADFLRGNDVPCVVGPSFMGPTKMELWGLKAENPAILDEAGVMICLTEDAPSNTRLLPMHTGVYIAMGLPRASAFRALTINPARLLGLDNRIGSIEIGKDADIAIWNGDPFSNYSYCETTIIDGETYEHGPVWALTAEDNLC